MGLEEGRAIAIRLARAVDALHRAGVIHRDIKPDNVMLEATGSLKLLDLGVVRVPGLGGLPARRTFPARSPTWRRRCSRGEAGDEATDIYALGVTMFRAFTGEYPYGNADAISPPRLDRPKDLSRCAPTCRRGSRRRSARAIAADPGLRYRDVIEFAVEMEAGPARAPAPTRRPQTLYERHRLRFWQGVAALLALGAHRLALAAVRRKPSAGRGRSFSPTGQRFAPLPSFAPINPSQGEFAK